MARLGGRQGLSNHVCRRTTENFTIDANGVVKIAKSAWITHHDVG